MPPIRRVVRTPVPPANQIKPETSRGVDVDHVPVRPTRASRRMEELARRKAEEKRK